MLLLKFKIFVSIIIINKLKMLEILDIRTDRIKFEVSVFDKPLLSVANKRSIKMPA